MELCNSHQKNVLPIGNVHHWSTEDTLINNIVNGRMFRNSFFINHQ